MTAEVLARENESNMAASPWLWEEDGSIAIKSQPVSITYCTTLNCVLLTTTDNHVDIIDVNSGDIIRRELLLSDEKNVNSQLQCVFNASVGSLVITNGTKVGLRKDINGIYLLHTILQAPLHEIRDEEIIVEMTLSDMEHIVSGLQAAIKNAHEPQLSMMERVLKKVKDSIQKMQTKITDEEGKLQKWATCCVNIDGETIHSALTHSISNLQTIAVKGPQLSSTSALLSQISNLLPNYVGDQPDVLTTKKKMWSEANRRKTFNNWPHKHYKWAVPETMAQAGFYHQSDRRTYPNSVDRAVCFTCNVGLVCWEPTDEPWSEHERHSPSCPFVRGECTENVPLSVTVATSPAQCHNDEKEKIACLSVPSSVALMSTSTLTGHVVVWDIQDELQVRCRLQLVVDDEVLANNFEEMSDLLALHIDNSPVDESTKEIIDEVAEIFLEGFQEGTSSKKPSINNKPSRSSHAIAVQGLGLLKNNQEVDSDEDSNSVQPLLSEAMLLAGMTVTTKQQAEICKHLCLVVCEIPADKHKQRPSGIKVIDEKSKSKPVSYSTQLSFESEDEFYDPLFAGSMPHDVFPKITSPTKDTFAKIWGNKSEESTIKDGKIIQCLNLDQYLEHKGGQLCVRQILPYHNGCYVLLVVASIKESVHKSCATTSDSPTQMHNDETNGDFEQIWSNFCDKFSTNKTDVSCEVQENAVKQQVVNRYLMLYKTCKIKGRTLLEEKPIKIVSFDDQTTIHSLILLPDDVEESFNATTDNVTKPDYLAAITAQGSIVVLDGLNLDMVTSYMAADKVYSHVVFCSGLSSFCASTTDNNLDFLHLIKNANEKWERSANVNHTQVSSNEKQIKDQPNDLSSDNLTLPMLKSLVEMTKFENLVPRYTAIVPVFWAEIQQEQQQRRHPQHLLQNAQGDASCHTRTWRLQKKGLVGGDQLFELMLPRPCYVGHVDVKFTMNKSIKSKNRVQVILSKPRSTTLRAKPTQSVSAQHMKGDLICGPVDLCEDLKPYGEHGHVVLTSPVLLRNKVRTLYVVFKCKPKASGQDEKNPGGGRTGFSGLEEISITVRSLSLQYNAEVFDRYFDVVEFSSQLLDIACRTSAMDVSGKDSEDLQWYALELMCWIAGITVHQPVSEGCLSSLLVECLPQLIQSCFLTASRSIAHKCSRLVVLCVSQLAPNDDSIEPCLLRALLNVLPLTLSCDSVGGLHWFFTLLTGLVSSATLDLTGASCVELLIEIGHHLDDKLTDFDRILRANFSLYGTPLDPMVFDVSNETLGLFASRSLSGDLLNPKTNSKTAIATTDVDEVDLMDYTLSKNNENSAAKMEKLLSCASGILEVEPLAYVCSSMSDGCKVDQGLPLLPAHPVPPQHGMYAASPHPVIGQDGLLHGPMATLQDHVHQLKEHEKLLSKLQKQKMQLEEQHQELEELGGMFFSNHLDKLNDDPWFAGKKLPSPKFGATASSLAAGSATGAKSYPSFGVKQPTPTLRGVAQQRVSTKTKISFQLPVPKVLVIEKLQTGSRHFVVLDFGQNVRLTDIFIPACPDLSSLVIDIWMDSEEKDLNRVTVSTDIGTKCLLLTDLLPPITCRYLKISLFALRGTLRTKLILGEYFGYPVPSEEEANDSEDMQRIHYLTLVYDDVFCQYGIACQRLESLLNCLDPAILNASNPSGNTKLLPGETNVRQAYTSCMNLQLRLNFLEHSIQRLEGLKVKEFEPPSTSDDIDALIAHASYSKLKSISDWLVHVLVSLFGIDEPTDEQGQQWYGTITLEMCQDLFTTFCVKGTCSSRAKVGALLLRMCGERTWWGGFLAWVMQHFFSCNQSMVFSRERLFLLLSSMSQLSSLQFTVITSGLTLLQSLLVPLSDTNGTASEPFDSGLLEWVTLYVCNLLDNFIDTTQDFTEKVKDGQTCSQNDDKNTNACKMPRANLTKRWDFIAPKEEDGSNDNSKDSKKEMQKIMKQIAIRQKRLQVLHQQHMLNKAYHAESYNSSPSSWSPPSPSQITHWNKQFRLKAKKPLKDLKRLKRMMANNSNQTTSGNTTPRQTQKLPRDLCLPVMKGLMTVLLSRQGACNVDFFVLICKILSCLKIVSYPAVVLSDVTTREQLDQLLRMCVKQQGVVHNNWSMGDHWIRHAATCLLQDLLTDMRISTVQTHNTTKLQEAEISDNNDTSDISCMNDNSDAASDNDVLNESTDLASMETGTEASIPEETGVDPLEGYVDIFPEVTPPDNNAYGCPIITIKDPTATTTKTPVISTSSSISELSTAEDCRLEISVEMKAERELRRLAFVSRQRFLAGMDLKTGGKLPDVETRDLFEDNERMNPDVSHVFSQCIGQLVVDAFRDFYDIDSVLELCLLLNNNNTCCSFFITMDSMNSFLQGYSTMDGMSPRSCNLAISWLRCMLRQITSPEHEHPYPTAKTLVEDPRVVRVIGNILMTYNYGNSGKKALGPSVVENFSSLLKSLMALQEQGVAVHTLQDLFLGILLIVTKHKDDGKTTIPLTNRPLDMCVEFLEFFTRHFPTSPHANSLAKYAMVFDSILSLVLAHLSSTNQVLCIGNSSKRRYTLAGDTSVTSRDPGVEVTANQFTVLCLKILGKLLSIDRGEKTEQSMFDYVLNDKASMKRLMCCVNMCRGESFGLIEIGLNILSSDLGTIDGLANPTSIEDGVLKTFCLLYKHCSTKNLVISAILDYFISDRADDQSGMDSAHAQLSELLLWVLLKLLDSDEMFRNFYENGGIEVICRKLCQASSRALHPMRGIVSTVVHQLGVKNVKNDGDKSLLATAWLSDKQLVNFAPFATINCVQENGNPPDPLISSSAPHRRARTALWSYHFKNNETWFSLDITLPNCIIVHEVLVQPHSTSLVMSTSYVTLELSHAGSTVSKISPPLLSAALGNIRLQLTTPELASVVRVRFHRPRDSDTLGLTRIEVLGTSFYGPVPQVQALLQSQKMSLNWSRALDYCIRRSHDLSRAVLETLSGITGILDVLLKILWSFPSSNLKTCIESTLVKLASHSSQHCTRLLTQLLYGGRLTKDGDGCLVGSLGVASDNSENELLYQLGILKDEQSWDRLRIICEWLLHVEKETKEQGKMVSNNVVSKLRTVAAIIWIINDDPSLCERLQSLITEEKFRCLYEWCQNCTRIPKLKLTLDYLICALCYVIPAYYVVPLSNVTVNTVVLDFSSLTSLAHASLSSRGAKLLLESSVLQDVISEVEKLCTKSSKGSKKVAKETDTVSTDFDKIRGTVEFLTLCLGQPVLKQWLGGDQGNYFWRSLLLFLMECHPRAYHARSTRASVCPRLLADLQTSVMNFFKKCVSGHPTNQRHLARVLHELFALVTNDDTRTLTGFLRRLILELLLDGDHVVLAVTCSGEISHCMMTALGNSSQSPLWHPRFGASNSCRLVRVRLNTTVQELTSLLVANPLRQLPKVTATNGSARKMSETLQDLMELLEISDISKPEAISLTTSAINVKHKRGGSHGNRENGESSGKETKVQDSVGLEMTHLICEDGPLAGIPLAKETTVAQIMECLLQHGQHLASVCIKLRVKSNVEQAAQVDVASNVVSKPVSNLLEVFSSLGGLALIANNLPPHFSVTMGDGSTRVLATTPSYMPAVLTSSVPGHSLMGFTMFLRLPGYANVLLEDQKSARIMLRLILGLEEDDAEQGSTLSQSLPTLPFNILDKILKLDAITTTTGVALRQTALDIGVVHLLLTTLGLLSHHEPRGRDMKHEATVEALKVYNTSDDIRRSQATGCTNSKQYWAKGTGFGTGSTSSGWDIEQALVKQKSEEEHITWILQVLASFVCPLGVVINPDSNIDEIALSVPDEDITNILPTLPEILMNSCLIPTLASYLRNDSVLDMARHVPLYRALLSLVRCMAVSPNLVPLLHPPRSQTATTTNGDSSSLCSLLTKMKLCVDTYGSRLKCSEKSKETKADKTDPPVSSTPTGTKQDEIENESLSLFIPDVQTTSMLVHKAVDHYRWDHLQNEGSQSEIDGQGTEAGKNMSTEERYSSVMMSLQFDTFHIVTEGADGKPSFSIPYHYSSSVKSATSSGQRTNAGRARRLAQEIASLSTSLPLSYNSSVFVRCDEERLDLMKVLITGPAETPYANGCFEFDVYFPPDYPSNPMHISFETTGNHRIRFNPNLYNDGKVCLSILNTWHGRPEEKWNSQTSSFLQVLVSIQSLILVPEPYFNEPGYERSRGTHSGTVNSREYDANIRQATVKWAMLEPLKKPCRCFKEVIERHFYLKKDEVLKQCDDWIRELEMWSKEKRTMRSITHHLESLRRHTTQLRDVISKLSDSCLETRDDDEDTDDKGDNEGGNGDAQGSKGNGEDDQGFKGHNQEYNGDNGTNAANEDSVKDGEKLGGDTY